MDGKAIEVRDLVKTYGGARALAGIDLDVGRGGVYGLLGPNGAGKTTLVRVLTTLTVPDGGRARVLGHDVVTDGAAVRAGIAATGQSASVDVDLTGAENLILIARLLGHDRRRARRRAGEMLDAFELADAGGRSVKTYSGGMRRRLDLAASMISAPQLLFLDEPTTGLDPRSRNQLWDVVRDLVTGGTTVLLTTQYLDEADQLADRIGVIEHGSLVAEGTPSELKASVGAGTLHVRLADPVQREGASHTLGALLGAEPDPSTDPALLTSRITDVDTAVAAVARLRASGVAVSEFSLGQPSLDEVFLSLTGRPAHAEAEVVA